MSTLEQFGVLIEVHGAARFLCRTVEPVKWLARRVISMVPRGPLRVLTGLSSLQGDRPRRRVMFLRGYFTPTLYTARLFARTVVEICLLVALIEGLYLSERFISVLKIVIDQPVGLTNVLSLLAWTAPEVHLALPLAILIATYRVVLLYRENREFIALASGGQGPFPLLQFASAVALAAMLCSLLISGELTPRAKFAFRDNVDAIRFQALRAGSTPGQFIYFPNYTIYVWPSDNEAARPIFIKQILDEKTYRVVNAKKTEIIDRSAEGSLIIGMLGVTISDLPNENERWIASDPKSDAAARDLFCKGCESQFKTLHSDSVARILEIKNLVPTEPRGVALDEWTTPELLGWVSAPGGRELNSAGTIETVRRLARALLCFLAPFLAWLTLTFTTRGSQTFALPLACVALMGTDIGFSQLITRFSMSGAPALTSILVAVTICVVAILIAQIVARQHMLIFPALERS
jgi:lipopolysaccharide export LptBFGC system permease protein LptF